MQRRVAAFVLATIATGCSPDPASVAYRDDATFRRSTLTAALWRPALPYAQKLLASYGFADAGWELLPMLPAASAPFRRTDAADLAAGRSLRGDVVALAADVPVDDAAWLALGREVFFTLPMRRDPFVRWLASRPDVWPRVGLTTRTDGTVAGLVRYRDADGNGRVGMTCALCHGAAGVAGKATRRLDLGLARALHAEAIGARPPTDVRKWGPGRIDVTDDGVASPTAIPDLWGVKHATHLNHSGVIAVEAAARVPTLAVRFETQFVMGRRYEQRPPRVLMWALARFVAELEPATRSQPAVSSGRSVFTARCASCHRPERGFSGGLIAASGLTSDRSVATTPDRGTGFYKVPSLIGVRDGAPYLHDGSQATLDALLSSGHPRGTSVPTEDRGALIAYLKTL